MLRERVEQDAALQPVARAAGRLLATGPTSIASWTDATMSRSPSSAIAAVAELEHLGEVVPRVDVQDREGNGAGRNAFSASRSRTRSLAAAEQQHRALELRGDLAHDEDRLVLERLDLTQVGPGHLRLLTSSHALVPAGR